MGASSSPFGFSSQDKLPGEHKKATVIVEDEDGPQASYTIENPTMTIVGLTASALVFGGSINPDRYDLPNLEILSWMGGLKIPVLTVRVKRKQP